MIRKSSAGISGKWKEILIGVLTIASIYLIFLFFLKDIILFLRQFLVFENFYQWMAGEIHSKSTVGLSIMTFLANLFFITYPSEVFFLMYAKFGYNPFYISAVMLVWMMVAQVFNYTFGWFIEHKFVRKIVKDNKNDFSYSLKRYDAFFVIMISLLPLPGDLLSVFLGMVKYDYKKAFLYTLVGKTLKYAFLILLLLAARNAVYLFF